MIELMREHQQLFHEMILQMQQQSSAVLTLLDNASEKKHNKGCFYTVYLLFRHTIENQ